jgi:hypothetical protein
MGVGRTDSALVATRPVTNAHASCRGSAENARVLGTVGVARLCEAHSTLVDFRSPKLPKCSMQQATLGEQLTALKPQDD